ncbi:MAG: VIT1/CCC1 transporter family protein [Myxococcota bacterium]
MSHAHDHQHTHEHPAIHEHRDLGEGWLRAAVFGLSDGLVSNTALVLGVASGASDGAPVILAGVAGLLAGAASMAAGEWISVTAQRETLEQELKTEREHLQQYPESEHRHMVEILESAGLSSETADQVALELLNKPDANLNFHARVELGIDPQDLGSPAVAALSSFIAFSIGALVPIAPWLLGAPSPTIVTIMASAITLFLAGAGLSFFTPRGALWSGTRQLLVGVLAAALTMAIGAWVGVQV